MYRAQEILDLRKIKEESVPGLPPCASPSGGLSVRTIPLLSYILPKSQMVVKLALYVTALFSVRIYQES